MDICSNTCHMDGYCCRCCFVRSHNRCDFGKLSLMLCFG